MEIFDFDNATDIVSNPIAQNVNLPGGIIYSIEFSPDGKDLTQTTPQAIQNSLKGKMLFIKIIKQTLS